MTITLKTLPETTAQQVFDQVAEHLLTQNAKSERLMVCNDGQDKMRCAYRGPNSLKCAAGCLIADDEYNSVFELKSWHHLCRSNYVPSTHERLIRDLQSVHDDCEPGNWAVRLRQVGNQYKLSNSVIDSLTAKVALNEAPNAQ